MAEKNETVCQFCWNGPEVESIAGKLHAETSDSGKLISAHHKCMQYASALVQYKSDEFGGFDISEVEKEISRGRKLRCSVCKTSKGKLSRGASCGCAVRSCRRTFHYVCAHQDPETITKRLVVITNKNCNDKEKFVYYRVFCSAAHEEVFRKTLKDELRGSKASQKNRISDKENSDSSINLAADTSLISHNMSSVCHNTSELIISPSIVDTVEEPAKLTLGENLLMSFQEAAITEAKPTAEDQVVTDSSEDRHATQQSATNEASTSGSRSKERRRSGFLRPKRVTAHVSQPPSCSMIEEASNSCSTSATAEAGSTQLSSPSAHQMLVSVVTESQSSAQTSADVVVHSPTAPEGLLREPHSSPKTSGAASKTAETWRDCVVALDKGIVEKTHTPKKQSCSESGKESSAVKSASFRAIDCQLNSSADVSLAAKGSESSPSETQKRPVARRVLEISPTKSTDSSSVKDSPRKIPVQGSPRKSMRIIHQSAPSEVLSEGPQHRPSDSPGQSPVVVSQNGYSVSEEQQETDVVMGNDISKESMPTVSSRLRSGKKDDSVSHGSVSSSQSVEETVHTAGESDAGATLESESRQTTPSQPSRTRKRKLNDDISSTSSKKPSQLSETTDETFGACILLIPSSLGEFQQLESVVTEMACDVLGAKVHNLCVWQQVTGQSLPPEQVLFFMLDLVKELESGGGNVLRLLFDKEHLASRKLNYAAQAEIFENSMDEKCRKGVLAAFIGGLERKVKDLPMMHFLQLPDGDLTTMAVDVRQCKDSLKLQAYIQAYKGGFIWEKDTEVATFDLSDEDRHRAASAEVLAWQVWLTEVNPVAEVIVLPTDTYLLDHAHRGNMAEFFSMVQTLKDRPGQCAKGKDDRSNSTQHQPPLLIFQPVDLDILHFDNLLRKACCDGIETKGWEKVLALVPLVNLEDISCHGISQLMSREGKNTWACSVSVRSAFCPKLQRTSLILLEISKLSGPKQGEHGGVQSVAPSNGSIKRGRGRPRKTPLDTPVSTSSSKK